MSFRTKLLLVVLLTIFASVSVVAYAVTHYTQAAFEEMDAERTEALVAQFKKEYVQRGEEIAHQAKNIAEGNFTEKMAIDLSRPNAVQSLYVRDAVGSAQEHGLDYVEFVNYNGVLISSAQFPARVGHKNDWVTSVKDWNDTPAFLRKEELPDGVSLSLSVVRTNNTVAGKSLYIVGGHRLDKNFLASLVLPTGMRALIYTNLEPTFVPTSLMAEKIDAEQAERFAPLVEQLRKQPQPVVRRIDWTRDPADAETFHAIPLTGRNNELLGIFFVGSPRGCQRKMGNTHRRSWPRRDRPARRSVQSHDANPCRAEGAPGANRARCRVARTGASSRARVAQSALSHADYH